MADHRLLVLTAGENSLYQMGRECRSPFWPSSLLHRCHSWPWVAFFGMVAVVWCKLANCHLLVALKWLWAVVLVEV
jgi:hypothetical protein